MTVLTIEQGMMQMLLRQSFIPIHSRYGSFVLNRCQSTVRTLDKNQGTPVINETIHVNDPLNNETSKGEYDLELLEKGIKKSNELTSNFTDYTYRFNRLPPNYGSNQFVKVGKELENDLKGIIDSFKAPIKYAFGYGSGVFQQSGYSKNSIDKPQIDLIFGVTHPAHFHSLNMRQNPHHYSSLKMFGAEFITKFQNIGAGIYFNPFVEINGNQVKYGVVSMETLLKDIARWDTFYLAGRLQKPVKILKNDLRVQYWNQLNLKAAATLGKYLTLRNNNGKLDEFEFYKEITGLSYLGDIRYALGGENPNKVRNIVEKNFDNFKSYYAPIYKEVVMDSSAYLPKGYTLETAIPKLKRKISTSSKIQTTKGIFTAGITKSIKYAWSKKSKAWKKP